MFVAKYSSRFKLLSSKLPVRSPVMPSCLSSCRMCLVPTRAFSIFSVQNKFSKTFVKMPLRRFARDTKKAKEEEEQAKKQKIIDKYEDTDLMELSKDWKDNFEECVMDFEDDLSELKSYRASPNMFDDVPVPAYGDTFPLSELGQTIVRGENNVLISVYDESIKESVMKAIIIHDAELECSMEGKYVSVKMGMTRAENRDSIAQKAKQKFIDFKSHLSSRRNEAIHVLKELEKVVPMDDIEIHKKELEENFEKFQKKGQKILDQKVADIKRK